MTQKKKKIKNKVQLGMFKLEQIIFLTKEELLNLKDLNTVGKQISASTGKESNQSCEHYFLKI